MASFLIIIMTHIFRSFLLLTIAGFFIASANANKPYEIKIKISGGFQDTALLLTSYYGDKIKIIDTAYAVKQGEYIFKGENSLPGGIYMVVSTKKSKLFEFIVDSDQKFTLSTDKSNYPTNMKVSGSAENKLFYTYLIYNEKQYQLNKSLVKIIDSLKTVNVETLSYKSSLDSLNEVSKKYKIEIIENNKGTYVSSLLNSMRDIEIPDSIKNSSDSTLTFKYYKQHYWDYIDLSDSTLLRSPVFMRKVKQYFEQLVVFSPDSVIAAIDLVVSKARPSQEVVGYLIWNFVSEYQNPKFMGFDKVFVHLVDEYFSKEQISNTTPSILTSLQDRANKLRPILLSQPAPNLILIDTAEVLTSFYSITNNYTILFFWDSDCGVCSKEIVELKKLYDNPDYDIEVFAINVNSDLEKWKKAITKKKVPGINVNGTRSVTQDFHDLYDIYGTPVIYLLDKDKKIVAKRINAGKVTEFIDNYERNPQAK